MPSSTQQIIQVNGESVDFVEHESIMDLLVRLKLSRRGIAVEVNQQIVSAAEFASCQLKQDDAIEIVALVGGG